MSVGLAAPGINEHTGDRAGPLPISTLVQPRTSPSAFSATRLTDTRTALTRGLAEYIEGLQIEQEDGRLVRFQKVFHTWAEPEEINAFPSAVARTPTPGTYDAKGFTPGVSVNCRIPKPDGRFLVTPSEFVIDITLEIWATDPVERTTLVAALEDAFNPFTSQYGFSLQLPHYHNVRGTYEPLQMGYMDNEVAAIQRNRKAVFTLNGRVPLVRLTAIPEARPSVRVIEVGPDVIVDG